VGREEQVQICDPARTVDERVLESFVEALLDPCVVVSRTGRVLAANSQWKQLPRRNEAAIAASNPIGIDYLALFQASILPEDCASLTGNIEAILSGQNREFEREYIRRVPHGIRWFRMTVRAWPQMDASAIIFHRDITDEKFGRENTQSVDEQFRALADSAPMLIWMSGPDKGCTFFNRRWLEFTGVPVADQLGEGWLELVHPDDRRAIMQTYERAFDGAREFEFDYRVRHHAGDYRWIRDNGSPRFDADNRLIGFIGSAWDMSDQMRATEEATVVSRYANLVRDMAAAANRAPSMREALQRSLDLICEAMNFPVGHALLIHDDEPELAKSAHIVYVKDMARFGKLFELSSTLTWPVEIGAPGEVLRTGKPLYTDVVRNAEEPDRYPRAAASLEAGLVGGIHIPILVDDRVEAIVEFGSEKQVIGDSALADVLTAANGAALKLT
jgi:PAS domain S-box-containing protein